MNTPVSFSFEKKNMINPNVSRSYVVILIVRHQTGNDSSIGYKGDILVAWDNHSLSNKNRYCCFRLFSN